MEGIAQASRRMTSKTFKSHNKVLSRQLQVLACMQECIAGRDAHRKVFVGELSGLIARGSDMSF